MGDSFCMIPIYTNHLNLGFNKGTLLEDPNNLLQGTGKWIRHIPIKSEDDFEIEGVKNLIEKAIALAMDNCNSKQLNLGVTLSKIKE